MRQKDGLIMTATDTANGIYMECNANQMKLLAILAMVVDHTAIVLVPDSFPGMWMLRVIGRMTAPIMCYFIAEGYYHTSNLKKYMGRLFLIAVAAHIPHNLCLGYDLFQIWNATDVMFPLLFGLIALTVWESQKIHPILLKLFIVGLFCLLAYSGDWNYIAVLWILGFGIFHGDIRKQLIAFTAVSCIYLLQPFVYNYSSLSISRFGIFLTVPLFLFYNGQRGKKSKAIQWGFYWFYPLHFLVIYAIGRILGT